jgi:hypothetical protein
MKNAVGIPTDDKKNKRMTCTHAVIVCVPDADLVVTLNQIVVIVRSVPPIVAAEGPTGIEGLYLHPSGVIDGDLKINVLQPVNILGISDGKRIIPSRRGRIRRNSHGELNPGFILAIFPVIVVLQVVPTGIARRRRLVDVITAGTGIGRICYNCCVGVVAKVGTFVRTPSVAAGDWRETRAALEAHQGPVAVRIKIAISAEVCWDV